MAIGSRAYRLVIVSAGSNDTTSASLAPDLNALRSRLPGEGVIWIYPRERKTAWAVYRVASARRDRVIGISRVASKDGVHPDRYRSAWCLRSCASCRQNLVARPANRGTVRPCSGGSIARLGCADPAPEVDVTHTPGATTPSSCGLMIDLEPLPPCPPAPPRPIDMSAPHPGHPPSRKRAAALSPTTRPVRPALDNILPPAPRTSERPREPLANPDTTPPPF